LPHTLSVANEASMETEGCSSRCWSFSSSCGCYVLVYLLNSLPVLKPKRLAFVTEWRTVNSNDVSLSKFDANNKKNGHENMVFAFFLQLRVVVLVVRSSVQQIIN
jgi:hypothetical protein